MLALVGGVALGFVLAFLTISAGDLTGGSANPARSLGPAIFSNNLGTYWIYVVGPLLGAVVAALIYKLFTIDFSCCDKVDDCGNKLLDECGNPLKECTRPIYDNCGNVVKDCSGKPTYETFTKHQRKIGHVQETPLLYMGEKLSSHGLDPRYIKQEFTRETEKVMKNGVMSNPDQKIKNAIKTVMPSS